jgi:iron complex transport system substrate-binding protein
MNIRVLRSMPTVFALFVFACARGLSAYTAVDALGRTLRFDRAPERVVLAGRGAFMTADALYLFPDIPPRLIAVERIAQGKGDFLASIDPRFHHKITLPSEVGPEQIAGLRPDLVILKSYMQEKLGRTLDLLGVKVLYLDFETPEQFEKDIATLGRVFQNEQRAADIAAFYAERAGMVERATRGLGVSERPRTLLLYYSERDGKSAFNVPPSGWMQTILVEKAGGVPAWKDWSAGKGWTKVGFEQVAASDPDRVFIAAYFDDASAVVERLYADRTWGALRAVRMKRLHAFPSDYYSWDQPDPRWILGLLWLARRLHPGLFTDMEIGSEARDFFREMYLLSDEEYRRSVRPYLSLDAD